MISYTHCPVCNSEDIHGIFSAKDHTVSQKHFVITECKSCTLLFTQDIPAQENIGKYYLSENYISHSDTQKGIINKLYHVVRKRTLNGKKKLVQTETGKKQGKILDIGCGTGAFLHTMKSAQWNIAGLEPDDNARNKATKLYGITPLSSDAIYSIEPGYDAITMWHVLEHVHELHKYIERLSYMLAPGGKIFIAVPNHGSYDAKFYGPSWAAWDVPRHLYHFSPQSMSTLVQQHGLSVKKIKPMWFDSFYVSMLSEKYKTGKGNIIRAFFVGLISNFKTMMKKERCSSLIYVISK